MLEVAGGYQIVDAARPPRVGPAAVPRALIGQADRSGAGDTRGDRVQAADHRTRDHRDSRREHSGVLSTLLERHLIKIVGRKKRRWCPFLYATTKEFLIGLG
jgi:hypothetical protein